MKFEWRKPDGIEVVIDDPAEILSVLNSLKARHDSATETGSDMEAATLKFHYQDQLGQWRLFMARIYQHEQIKMVARVKELQHTLVWWDEWSDHDGGDRALSEVQKWFLADVSPDLLHLSWASAAKILNNRHHLRPPSDDFERERKRLVEKLSIASSCVQLADNLKTKFFNGETPERKELDTYHAKIVQLTGAINDAGL